jgi:hypothetical protein
MRWDPAADMHYTTSGVDPTRADPELPTVRHWRFDSTTTFRMRAWVAGRAPSAVVTATYVLQPDVPVITPGTATYASAQNVSITTATANTLLRFTVDGTDIPLRRLPPTRANDRRHVHGAESQGVPRRMDASTTATATFTLNYGTLAPPVAQPRVADIRPGSSCRWKRGAGRKSDTRWTAPILMADRRPTSRPSSWRTDF